MSSAIARGACAVALCALVILGAAGAVSAPAQAAPSLTVRAAILTDEATGTELYGVDADRELAIASTTKLMTALVTLEHARLSRMFTEPNFYFPPIDSQIGLRPGER